MAGVPDEVPLHDQIHFLKNVVIPSFGNPPPFQVETTRADWMRNQAKQYEHEERLMLLLGNVLDTKQEAIRFLEILTRPQQTGKSRIFYEKHHILIDLISLDNLEVLTGAVVAGLRQFYGSPLVQSSGTNSRGDEAKLSENRQLSANFAGSGDHVVETTYPSFALSTRQLNRIEQHKYFEAIKKGVKDRYGENRYAIQKSRHKMYIRDGSQKIFACSINDHSMRCAYLDMLSLDFNVDNFIATASKSAEEYFTTISPEHL
jgi:hypothetical protein